MIGFKVSVIVPVYNAENYVEQAVESAIHLEEVGEVILIEDGSPDNALEVCKKLEGKYQNVVLLQHEDQNNKGAGASRNLGIRHASFDYIAFLDADDWFLPNRFQKEKRVFSLNPDADGVYGATGYFFQKTSKLDLSQLTRLRRKVPPDELIFSLLDGKGGRFTTNAITYKTSFLKRLDGFDEDLRLHQDTHLWLRSAVLGKLYHGEIESAIAVRRVHKENRISLQDATSHRLFNEKVFKSFYKIKEVDRNVFITIFKRYVASKSKIRLFWYPLAIKEIFTHPCLILKLL